MLCIGYMLSQNNKKAMSYLYRRIQTATRATLSQWGKEMWYYSWIWYHASLLDKWIKQSQTTGLFKKKENRSDLENELIELRKQNKPLEMKNDLLKQAALILGRK